MTPIMKFEGIYTPVVTPYDGEGNVVWDALAAVVDHLVDNGVHGLISGGSTGENYAQTVEERLELARFTAQRLAGRLPLIVGTGTMRTPDSVALAEGAAELGADAILVATPPYSVPTERENALNVLTIDRAADLRAGHLRAHDHALFVGLPLHDEVVLADGLRVQFPRALAGATERRNT